MAGVTGDEGLGRSRPVVAVVRPASGTSTEEAERLMAQLADLSVRNQALLAELTEIRSEPVPQWQKNTATVLSLVKFVSAEALELGPVLSVLELLDRRSAKFYADLARGMVASAVAILRQADSARESGSKAWLSSDMEAWLRREIASYEPEPSFTIENARRWFNDCATRGAKGSPKSRATLDGFNFSLPDTAQLITEEEAKAKAANFLRNANYLTIAPLGKQPLQPRGWTAPKTDPVTDPKKRVRLGRTCPS